MTLRTIAVLGLVVSLAGCSPGEKTAPEAEPTINLADKAKTLALDSIIVDTHIDVPYRLEKKWVDVTEATAAGDFDYPRAIAGGLNAPFMSIFTQAELAASGESKAKADELIDLILSIVESAPEKFALALSADDVEAQFANGLISLPMGMENGSPIENDLANLTYFYARGIRYITLAHSLSNLISDSSYDKTRQWDGISKFGEDVVREMNRLGIIVDVSHITDAAFYDVLEVSTAPVIATHSSARHFTPGFERNMADDMIEALAAHGGLIMINYGSSFLTEKANVYSNSRSDAYKAYLADNDLEDTPILDKEFNQRYAESHGVFPFASLEDVLNQFDHVIELVGVEHVGIGSDYDGVGDSLPVGLKDVSSYPNLVHGLLLRDYSDDDVRKILGTNLLRVWREIEAAAEQD